MVVMSKVELFSVQIALVPGPGKTNFITYNFWWYNTCFKWHDSR